MRLFWKRDFILDWLWLKGYQNNVRFSHSDYKATIEVTGEDIQDCTGKYFLTNKSCDNDPSLPVYKHEERDRYIYNTGISKVGWRIGAKENLSGKNVGSYWFKSNSLLYLAYLKIEVYSSNFCPLLISIYLLFTSNGSFFWGWETMIYSWNHFLVPRKKIIRHKQDLVYWMLISVMGRSLGY